MPTSYEILKLGKHSNQFAECSVYHVYNWSLKKKKKKTDFGGLATFWRGTFATVIHDTGSLLGQENTRRPIVSCHKGLFAARF